MLVLVLACASAFAHNKVVVIPLDGGGEAAVIETGSGIPAVLSPVSPRGGILTQLTETITSPIAGRWQISKSGRFGATCSTSSIMYLYFVIDGVPLRSSVQSIDANGADIDSFRLFGVTLTKLPKGQHTLDVGFQCSSGNWANISFPDGQATSIVIFP